MLLFFVSREFYLDSWLTSLFFVVVLVQLVEESEKLRFKKLEELSKSVEIGTKQEHSTEIKQEH